MFNDYKLAHDEITPKLFNLMEYIFKPIATDVESFQKPFMRAFDDLNSGKVDAHVGSFAIDMEGYIFPRWHFYLSHIGVIFKKDKVAKWQGYKTLSNNRVGWIRGYYFNLFFDKKIPIQLLEVSNLTQCINLIKSGRLDFCMDGMINGLHPISKQMQLSMDEYRIETLYKEPTFLRFLDTPRSKKIIALYDNRMDYLYNSGKLANFYKKLKLPPISPKEEKFIKRPKINLKDILAGTDDWAAYIKYINP
ncbi:MAG: transporter substrate-binding domain-containing protein [Magnetococcales bacterium]|nr:transporter substrate-binding domain-containing protein [Magnetococcales bacterium]